MILALRKKAARLILIDRAPHVSRSRIDRIAQERSDQNYRFASSYVTGKDVLDIGGGAGTGHVHLLNRAPRSLVSIDPYAPAAADHRVRCIQGDFLEHPFADGSFDVITCLGTLFYLPDPEAGIAKMHRLLRPQGRLLINCINRDLVRYYFGAEIHEIDRKFSRAFAADELRALLVRLFGTQPDHFQQQPVPVPTTMLYRLRACMTPIGWLFRENPVVAARPGALGMFNYFVAYKT